jgi:hypothetical protein
MRATLNTVPATNDLLATSAMPLALVVSPLALQEPGDDTIQVGRLPALLLLLQPAAGGDGGGWGARLSRRAWCSCPVHPEGAAAGCRL